MDETNREIVSTAIDSPCECEHNQPDSLGARLFPSVVSAVAPAVTMDEASSLWTVTVGQLRKRPEPTECATANTTLLTLAC